MNGQPPRTHLSQHPVLQLTLARLRESYRRPETVFWVYGFPLLMVATLGTAFRSRPIERFAVDVQASSAAEQVAKSLGTDARFVVAVRDEQECRRRLRVGRCDVVLVAAETRQEFEYRYDPTQPKGILARNAVNERLQQAAGRQDVVAVRDQEISEPGSRYIDFLVPGLLGMSLLGGGMWGVGFAIVDMRIRKLLKRLAATPMRQRHFVAGMMLSRLLFLIPEMVLLLTFATLVFRVVNYGSWLSVVVLILLGAVTFAGIGLLIASRAQTLEAVSGLMNLFMLPMWIFSGIFFSSDRFPQFAQPLIRCLPLTPLIASLRSVMLEGATLAAQWPNMLILVAWSAVCYVCALRWFRWT